MADGRNAILYDKQPLLQDHRKLVLHLVDDKYNPILGAGGPKKILKDLDKYNAELPQMKLIGYVD